MPSFSSVIPNLASHVFPQSFAESPEKPTSGEPENDQTKKPDCSNPRLPDDAVPGPGSYAEYSDFDMAHYLRTHSPVANGVVCAAGSLAWWADARFLLTVTARLKGMGLAGRTLAIAASAISRAAMMSCQLPLEMAARKGLDHLDIATPTHTPQMDEATRQASMMAFTLPFSAKGAIVPGLWASSVPTITAHIGGVGSVVAGFAGGIWSGSVLMNADPNALMKTNNGQADNNKAMKTDGKYDVQKMGTEIGVRTFAGGVSGAMSGWAIHRFVPAAAGPRKAAVVAAAVTGSVFFGWMNGRAILNKGLQARPPSEPSASPEIPEQHAYQ